MKAPANMQFPFHGEKDKYGSCTAKKSGFSRLLLLLGLCCWQKSHGTSACNGREKVLHVVPLKVVWAIKQGQRNDPPCWGRAAHPGQPGARAKASLVGAASLETKLSCGYTETFICRTVISVPLLEVTFLLKVRKRSHCS